MEELIILRVISGKARGCKLKTTKGLSTRPTTDRVKESLFNVLGCSFEDLIILDLFAGSGSLGIETLSRGAKKVVFIDKSYECCSLIKDNLNKTKLIELAEVYHMDSIKYLNQQKKGKMFNMIFLDPPYNENILPDVLNIIGMNEILADKGILVVEKHVEHILNCEYGELVKFKEKIYGKTSIVLFEQK